MSDYKSAEQTIDSVIFNGEVAKAYDSEYQTKKTPDQYKKLVMYICNQKKCGESCSVSEGCCYHTTDVRYSAHYMNQPPNKTLDKRFDKNYMILDEPCVIFTERRNDEDNKV